MFDDESDCDLSSDDEDDEGNANEHKIPYGEAINAVDTLIKLVSNDSKYANRHMSNLLMLRPSIVKNHFAQQKTNQTR